MKVRCIAVPPGSKLVQQGIVYTVDVQRDDLDGTSWYHLADLPGRGPYQSIYFTKILLVKCCDAGATSNGDLTLFKVYEAWWDPRDPEVYHITNDDGEDATYYRDRFETLRDGQEEVPPTLRSLKVRTKESEEEANKKALMSFFKRPAEEANCICGCRRTQCLYHG